VTVGVKGGTIITGAANALSGTTLNISSGLFNLNGCNESVR